MNIEVKGVSTLLLVFDMPTSMAFYRDLLGFEVVQTSVPYDDAKDHYSWAMLRLGGAELMLNDMHEPGARPLQKDALRSEHHRDTVLYFLSPNVNGVHEHLLSQGVDVKAPVDTFFGMRQLAVTDPDGYSLVFQWARAE